MQSIHVAVGMIMVLGGFGPGKKSPKPQLDGMKGE